MTLVYFSIAAFAPAYGEEARPPQETAGPTAEQMKQLLQNTPASPLLFPELEALSPSELAALPVSAVLVDWGKGAAATTELPQLTYSLYRLFKKTGDRSAFQTPYFEKRSLLAREALVLLLSNDLTRLDRVNDLIWSICEETSWVLPAHEKDASYIDLAAAETGAWLAQIAATLGDTLPKEIHERVHQELTRRIFDPFLTYGEKYGWSRGLNNWTGVCAGSVGQAFLLYEKDEDRLAQALALIVQQLERFIDKGFHTDGSCLEGIGYWSYGLSEYVVFAEMLRVRTAGAIDLLAHEKMPSIAAYPLSVYLGNNTYASFADSQERNTIDAYLAGHLSKRTGNKALAALASPQPQGQFHFALRNILWEIETVEKDLPITDLFLPESGIIKLSTPVSGGTLTVIAKAGHNAEPHNNNDVGSFIVAVDGVVYLCDPGAGLYNRDYFSGKRYESIFANSYGHSVPRIQGKLQATGPRSSGSIEQLGDKGTRIRFEAAYAMAELEEAERIIQLQAQGLTLQDRFHFQEGSFDVEEALMTWQRVEAEGDTVRIMTDTGTLEIQSDGGSFAVESLEDICKANKKKGILSRITLTGTASPDFAVKFRMQYYPNTTATP
ncbi:MAG: hypothetical protein GX117_00195 [Candidatus Hydrogenedentes bacterium]|nr:hypothetical protein [Candidatus Hydrogenedentota bacterium]